MGASTWGSPEHDSRPARRRSPVRTRPFPAWPIFGQPEEERLLRTLRSGNWGRLDGHEVEEFEQRFAAMHGCSHGIAVVNGTVSLRIALLAAGIRSEDEVIVPPYTFISTASAVVEANAVPVFADIDLHTFNLDPNAVEAAITPRTRAIIPVHFAGQPADMDAIMAIAGQRGLIVIEDAAHAHGASYQRTSGGIARSHGVVLVPVEQEPDGGRRGHHHHERCRARRVVPFDPQLRARAGRHLVRASRDGRQLPPRRAPGGDSQLPAGPPRGSDSRARCQWTVSGVAAVGICPVFTRRRERPRARDTAITCSCCASTAPCSARRARRFSGRSRLRASRVPPATASRCPISPSSGTRRSVRTCPGRPPRLDYSGTQCPTSDLICREQCIWLGQNLFLGARSDMDDIALAFEKVYEHRESLAASGTSTV